MAFNTTPFHGKKCRVEKNGTNLEYNIDWNINVALNMGDGQRMGQQWDEKYPGRAEWNGSFRGGFAPGNTEQKAFFDNIITASIGTKLTDIDFNLDSSDNYFEGDVYLTKLHIEASKDSEVKYNISFKGNNILRLCPGCGCAFSYDGDNPETIAQNGDVEITISGGIAPFGWVVTGTGFSFDDASTQGRSNTLRADGASCGAGNITVTDFCNEEVTGCIRNTTGEWIQKSDDVCTLSGAGTASGGSGRSLQYELIEGCKKQWQLSYCPANIGDGTEVCATYYWYFGMTLAEFCTALRASNCSYAIGPRCANCIDPDHDICDCNGFGTALRTWCVQDLKYYEWECSP